MKILFSVLFFVSLLASCTKESVPNDIQGSWKMTSVMDNITGIVAVKPQSLHGDVVVNFSLTSATSGVFKGHTINNEIWRNDFNIGANNSITIASLAMTKVGEPAWSDLFIDNFPFSETYALASGNLLIIRTANKTLTFKKM
jgi:hypothetical protein